jgi:hypothetical protein
MSRRAIVGLLFVLVTAMASVASALASPRIDPAPRWLVSAEQQMLDRVFEHAQPVHTYFIPYPRKIAVVWVFRRVVICGACSAPSNASLPRGRVIRVSFDRRTHAVRESDGLRFCETRGPYPPLAECLHR